MRKPLVAQLNNRRTRAAVVAIAGTLILGAMTAAAQAPEPEPAESVPAPVPVSSKSALAEIRIARLCSGQVIHRRYPYAVPSMLEHVSEATSANVVAEPTLLDSFEDRRLFDHPFL